MPDDKVKGVKPSQMRASTGRERIGDMLRSAYESVAEQPLARISDALGLSDLSGIATDLSDMKTGVMPGGPPGPALMGLRNTWTGAKPALSWEQAIKQNAGGNPFKPRPLAPERNVVATTGPGPEFQQLDNPHFAPSRYSIDPNVMPPGKMEYLDPDIEMIMNPSPVDVTSRQGQQKLRALMGR